MLKFVFSLIQALAVVQTFVTAQKNSCENTLVKRMERKLEGDKMMRIFEN